MSVNKINKGICLLVIVLGVFMTMGSSFMVPSTMKYVDAANGADSNDGLSINTAWKTLQKAVSNVQPGDTILVRGGTYSANIVVSITGTATSPIKLTNYPGETVVIDGGAGIALRSSGKISYWTIEGLTFKSSNRYTLRLGWWGEPLTDHFTVKNNRIFGANYIMGSYHLWENNIIDGTGYAGTDGDAGISDGGDSNHNTYRYNTVKNFTHVDARGIWTQGKTHDSVIEYNTVDNIKASGGLGQCIDLDGAAQVEWRHTVRGNTVSNCNYAGIQLENVFDSVVENNIIRNTAPAGIIIISYDAGVGCAVGGENNQYGDTNGDKNCQGDLTKNIIRQNVITTTTGWGAGYGGIINWYAGGVNYWGNTINAAYGNNNGGINIQGNAAQVKGNSIKDNIISQGKGPAVCIADLKYLAEESNNLYNRINSSKPFTSNSGCSTDYSLTEFQTMTGLGQNTLFGDPAYINSSNNDYRLSSSSQAIDKGINIGTSLDADGNTRLVGVKEDIGAYEYGSIVPTATSTGIPTATALNTSTPSSPPTITTPTATNTFIPTNTRTSTPTITSRPPVGYGTYDERSAEIVYSGSWVAQSVTGNYLKTEMYSNVIGSSAQFTFSGESINVIYRGYPNAFGNMEVRIDGAVVATINQNTSTQTLQNKWTSNILGSGSHTLKLTHMTGTYISLDGLIVSGLPVTTPTSTNTITPINTPVSTQTITPLPPVESSSYDERSADIVYTGSWVAQKVRGNYMNTEKYSTRIGSTAKFIFSGDNIGVIYRGYPNAFGNMEVRIDGKLIATINENTSTQTFQKRWSSAKLLSGPHTLTLTHKTGNYVSLDGLVVGGKILPTPTTQIPVLPTIISTATPTNIPIVITDVVPTSNPTIRPTDVPNEEPTAVPTLMEIDNVAIGKISEQSSNYENAESGRAVDGNIDGNFNNNSVTHTQEGNNNWWMVDLGDSYLIKNIKIWTRTDCCEWRLNNFYVYVSDQPFTSFDVQETINQAGVSSYYIGGNGGRPSEITINRTGRYLRVQLTNRDALSLAEVQVIAYSQPTSNLTTITNSVSLPTSTNLPQNTATPEIINTPTPTPIP
jgi:hypothetical protein